MNHFFSPEGPLMRALSELTTLVVLNLLTLVCCIPVVTAGAAYASLHYCVMKLIDGEGRPVRDYFRQLRQNLFSVTPVWLALLAAAGGIGLDFIIFPVPEDGSFSPLHVPVYGLMLVLAVLCVWLFPLMARIENRFAASFKNAAILAVGHLPRTLIMLVIYALAIFVFTQELRLLPIAFVLGLSLPAYLCAFVYRPVIHKVMDRMNRTNRNP